MKYILIIMLGAAAALCIIIILMLKFRKVKYKRNISGRSGVDIVKRELTDESGGLRGFDGIENTVVINNKRNNRGKMSVPDVKVTITNLGNGKTSNMFLGNRIDFGRVNSEGYGNFYTAADPSVSKKHCGIFFDNNNFFVSDYNSRNGTFVNGRRITPAAAVPEQFDLRIGNVKLMIRLWR
ncbi:MAG: FHA domain-containing protein [Porcipelethomonas sp.]